MKFEEALPFYRGGGDIKRRDWTPTLRKIFDPYDHPELNKHDIFADDWELVEPVMNFGVAFKKMQDGYVVKRKNYSVGLLMKGGAVRWAHKDTDTGFFFLSDVNATDWIIDRVATAQLGLREEAK